MTAQSNRSDLTVEEKILRILDAVQEQTIVVNVKGSVHGPEEDARAFQAIKDTAHVAILRLVLEGQQQTADKYTKAYKRGGAEGLQIFAMGYPDELNRQIEGMKE